MERWTLRLIAGNDLTYHHAVEIDFTGVGYVSTAIEFDSPRFREPEMAEVEMVKSRLSGDLDGLRIIAWNLDDAGIGIIAAEAVEIREGHVRHEAFFEPAAQADSDQRPPVALQLALPLDVGEARLLSRLLDNEVDRFEREGRLPDGDREVTRVMDLRQEIDEWVTSQPDWWIDQPGE